VTWHLFESFFQKADRRRWNFCHSGDRSMALWRLPASIAVELRNAVFIEDGSRDVQAFLLLLQGPRCMSGAELSTWLVPLLTRGTTSSSPSSARSGLSSVDGGPRGTLSILNFDRRR